MPTLGVDTLPSQRVPQKILKKSISLYYMLSFAFDMVLILISSFIPLSGDNYQNYPQMGEGEVEVGCV